MATIEEMTVQELQEFIDKIAIQSACDRANKEKLKQVLEAKQQRESLQEPN